MFAALTFEREPLTFTWSTFFHATIFWLQTAGLFAAICLLVAVLVRRSGGQRGGGGGASVTASVWSVVLVAASLAAAAYIFLAFLYVPELLAYLRSDDGLVPPPTGWRATVQYYTWAVGGGIAIIGVMIPMVYDLLLLSPRRILALARLTFKEAVRRKILWAFLSLLLLILFGSWFIPHKYEDEVRNYVQVVSVAKALLLLLGAGLLAAFGIHDDIRHQTIHTVLTKPVQRFEIFLGRFLGYTWLMTLVLIAVSGFGLLYVLRGVGAEAQQESLKARVPLYGRLHFEGTKERERGENVGREWDYRSYIFGPVPNMATQYAVWTFQDPPSAMARREKVRVEFTFDIYRTTKGQEGKGVLCTFLIESWRFDPTTKGKYDTRRAELRKDPATADKIAADALYVEKELAREFGYFEIPAQEILDYHTQYVEFPAALLEHAMKDDPERRKALEAQRTEQDDKGPFSPLRIRVRCDSRTQFLGMAKHDLYLRQDDASAGTDRLMFCLNFFKGGMGVWMRLCLVIGIAVALSTYLSGVITLITTGILYVLGFFQEFIAEVAFRKNVGGGPLEAAKRLVGRPGGESIAAPLEDTAAVRVITGFDKVFSWGLQRILDLIPDVSRYSFTDFVAEGVSISGGQMLMTFLVLAGYLLPWAVLAYYLLRWREVASST